MTPVLTEQHAPAEIKTTSAHQNQAQATKVTTERYISLDAYLGFIMLDAGNLHRLAGHREDWRRYSAGDGVSAISSRLSDARVKALFTADGLFRRGRVVPLKVVGDYGGLALS
jgi:hypothetical protein